MAQTQPANISELAFAIREAYVLLSHAGTWTNVPRRPRAVRQDIDRGRLFCRETSPSRAISATRVEAQAAILNERDPRHSGRIDDRAYFTTDPELTVETTLTYFSRRWSQDVDHSYYTHRRDPVSVPRSWAFLRSSFAA
jgi:hypothetical protein